MKSGDKAGDVMCEYQHIQAEDEEKDIREHLGVVLDNIPIWHTGGLKGRQRPIYWIGNGPDGVDERAR